MERKSILDLFALHPVAMNVLMFLILALGVVSLSTINRQFFPSFELKFVSINTSWPGAAAEDVERSITDRLELELRNIDELEVILSTSRNGHSTIILEFDENTDIQSAVDDTKQTVDLAVSSLPADSELPEVIQVKNFEVIASLIVTASEADQLRGLAYEFKDELLADGIGKIDIIGLPEEEISIRIPSQRLRELQLDLNQIGEKIRAASIDVPIGILGREDAARQLRFVEQRRSELEFENIPIIANDSGGLVTLKDIAEIERRPKQDQVYIKYQGKPAVQLALRRLETADTLDSAQILYDWMQRRSPTLPPSVALFIYDDRSTALLQRLQVLLKNGVAGLLLVLAVLFIFLNARLAFWVAVGIPVALLGAISLLNLAGGTMNMVSMFAFIMTLGIIVDDAIVVGEDAQYKFKSGSGAAESALGAARNMFIPIIAASLTTIFAFIPTAIVPGIMGTIMSSLTLVVVCVVAVSVIEAFFILPGHLHHSFKRVRSYKPSRFSEGVDRVFQKFQNRIYRPLLTTAINRPLLTMSIGFAALILTFGLVSSGRLQYSFFPSPELDRVIANVSFVSGTPRTAVNDYLEIAEEALLETEQELGGGLISSYYIQHGATISAEGENQNGSSIGSIAVELIPSDTRDIRVSQYMHAWRDKFPMVPGLESLTVTSPSAGTRGRDIEIYFSGDNRSQVKNAAIALTQHLKRLNGIYGAKDDTSYGHQQHVMTLTSKGESLGLTVNEISRQLRSAIEGYTLQSYTSRQDEIDVIVKLSDAERDYLSSLENLHVRLPSGESVPLLDVVRIKSEKGFDTLYHKDAKFTIAVTADVDESQNNTREILTDLESSVLPQLVNQYGVDWVFGRATTTETEAEDAMKLGAMIALLLIYLTLTWIFGSYFWPIVVMLSIPFGFVGAAWGYYLLGMTVSMISIFGLIGLSGIVVNNAIVLVVRYKQNVERGLGSKEAMIEAGCRRLRPVFLTTLTTIAGLLPLLFEKSTQAQFLIPMVVTIVFGLAFSTILTLLFIPAVLTLFETIRGRIQLMLRTGPATDDEAAPAA